MATLKAVVDHRKADGTYCVKIRLTHNRKALYIPTMIYVTDRELTKSKKIKDTNVVMTTNKIIDGMRSAILSIENVNLMTCEQLRDAMLKVYNGKDTFKLDFYEYALTQIAKMKPATALSHMTAINNLKKYKNHLDINDITNKFIISFKSHLNDNGVSKNSINLYLTKIQHIINLAKDEFNDDDNIRVNVRQFKKGVIERNDPSEHRVLTAAQIRRIATFTGDRYENFARDIFILSFCLIGINIVDLYNLKKKDVQNGILTYNRAKTKDRRADKARISIRIEEEAMNIIQRYTELNGEQLLNFHRRYKSFESMSHSLMPLYNRFKRYDKSLPSRLTFYHARHSWATIAYNDCGIDMQTIHEALNHASDANMKITDIYVKKDFTRIWEANRKVLDYVFGEKQTPSK